MKTLKLTVPGAPTNWHAKSYVNQKSPLSNDWKIEVNTRILEADAWFVCEDLVDEEERCSVPSGMLFLGSAETSYEHDWIVSSKAVNAFYSQFDRVHTFNMFEPQKTVPSIPFLPWMLHANHGPTIFEQPGYQELISYNPKLEDKQKRIIKTIKSLQKTSKYGVDLVVDIKNKLKEGYKIKQLKELYPDVKENFFYNIKNGRRWVSL